MQPYVPEVPGWTPRFYLKSLIGPPWHLPWVPEARFAQRRENDRQPAIQHFALYAFAAGEREDLWYSWFSLACVKSVSFVEKVGTRAKKRWGRGKGEKESSSLLLLLPFFLLSLLLSRSNWNGNVFYEVISTRQRQRRTLRVGGKDVFSLCCLQSLLMKMNPLSIKVLCKKSQKQARCPCHQNYVGLLNFVLLYLVQSLLQVLLLFSSFLL